MPSHYLNQCWNTCTVNSNLSNKLQWNLKWNSNIFTQENAFANVIWTMSTILSQAQCVNSLWPSDVIGRRGSRSTLVQVMACCLTAPSHYLNQCWLIISKIKWHSSEGNFTAGISVIGLKSTHPKFHKNLPVHNELKSCTCYACTVQPAVVVWATPGPAPLGTACWPSVCCWFARLNHHPEIDIGYKTVLSPVC